MPEQEELKLVVTLDDQASAKLANLKQQLAGMGGSTGSGFFGAMGQQAEAAGKATKGLHAELGALAGRAGFIGGVVGGITSELVKMGKEMLTEITNLKKLTEETNNFTAAAARMGLSTTALENNLRGFRAGGASIESATQSVAGLSDAMADLTLVNSRLRSGLLTGGFLEIPKMLEGLQRVDMAGTEKDKMVAFQGIMKEIEERWTKLGNPQLGARMARNFREMIGIPELDRFVARTREVGEAEDEVATAREHHAAEYQKHLTDQEIGMQRIINVGSLMVYKIDETTHASELLGKALNVVATELEKSVTGKYADKYNQMFPDTAGGRTDFNQTYPGWPTSSRPPATPPDTNGMPLPFFSGGAAGGGANSSWSKRDWSWMRRSEDIEDRRDLEDNTDQTKELTDEIKTLNENLTIAPPGSMAAALGINQIGGGRGVPQSMLSTGGDASPNVASQGTVPQGVGGKGAMGGMVHGHEVDPTGHLPPGTKLFEPMTGSMGGGVGGHSAMFGPNMHEGVDIMGPEGSNVYASRDGVVVRAPSPSGGRDQVLTIKHPDGTYSRYLHQRPGNVAVGDTVKGGQVVGKSGYRNAPHTHFEMWNGPPGARGSKLMNPKVIFGWDKDHPAVGGREVTVGGEPPTASSGPSAGDAKSVKGSWFGNAPGWRDPSEPMDSPKSSVPGIALRDKSTMGRMFEVTTPDGRKFILPQTDYGPAARTGRGIDVTAAAAARMGYTSKNFPTDAPFSYRLLDKDKEVTVNGKGELNVKVQGPAGTRVDASGDGLLKDTRVQQETQMEPASKGSPNIEAD